MVLLCSTVLALQSACVQYIHATLQFVPMLELINKAHQSSSHAKLSSIEQRATRQMSKVKAFQDNSSVSCCREKKDYICSMYV
jgi:hypothetical protein